MIEQFYESIIRINTRMIELSSDIIPMVHYIKDGEEVISEQLKITKSNKEQIKLDIKSKAVKGGYGYVLVLNTVAKRKKQGITIEGDCCIRALYTPKNKILDMVWHNKGEILAVERVEGRGVFYDAYDCWNEGDTIGRQQTNKESGRG